MAARKTLTRILPVLICSAAILWLLAACSDADHNLSGPPMAQEETVCMTTDDTQQSAPVVLTPERIHEVRVKYNDLFWRQPNVWGVGEGQGVGEGPGYDAQTGWSTTSGIVVSVTTKVAQSTLPTADRIPSCLEGVPVMIEELPAPKIIPSKFSTEEDNDDGNE